MAEITRDIILRYLRTKLPSRYLETWMSTPSMLFNGKSADEMIALGKADKVLEEFKRVFQ
jgi:hypothetical protein